MCGRFSLELPAATIAEYFLVHNLGEVTPRFNIAPTQEVLCIFRDVEQPEQNEAGSFHWGLVPHWAKDTKIAAKLINARGETLREKPSFRGAFKYRRCLIPVSGFYEWQRLENRKQPFFIRPAEDNVPFAFAGLWEQWTDPESGSELWSCTIVTTDANRFMQSLHHRMPVILARTDFDAWLDLANQDSKHLQHLLKPCPDDWMTAYPVSTYVNRNDNEGPRCIEPQKTGSAADQPGLFD